ncbi:acyl-CoA dehydrogenase family protein [Massilia putida]|uniref:acyl-CoA dehydrogenase family protein n=1 Tax=Massilia putida TaxID=1141883 RepID=UPI00095181A9|nr:acyl-CoA dehydrogenase family protein [Massilia putida]
MNFEFSDEQEELRRQARRLLADGLAKARGALDHGASHDAALWRQIVDMGWPAAAIPEQQGGLGLGPLELCVLAEETGRTLAPVPFATSVLHATEALKLCPADPLAGATLGRLAEGGAIATVAFAEEGGGRWDAIPAARVEAGRLTGVKTAVAEGSYAGFAVVSARAADDEDGYGWWLVDLDAPGVTRTGVEAIDCVRRHATLAFDRVPAARLGGAGEGAGLVRDLLDRAAVYDAFEQLGGAEAALAMTIDYVKTRQAFGRPVAGYQAVKHKLADLYVKVQLARSHAYYGAWALLNDVPELPVCAAGARLAATDAFTAAAEESVQLHGGIGFTWESDCQLYYRRARLLAAALGSRAVWSRRLAHALVAHGVGVA